METPTAEPSRTARPRLGWVGPFLTALRATGNVRAACRAAGVNKETAYDRCRSNPAFAADMQKSRAAYFASLVPVEGAVRE